MGDGEADRDAGDRRSRSGSWRARIYAFLTVSTLWLLWSGPVTFHHGLVMALWPVSALLVVWLCDRLGLITEETLPLELTFRTLAYVPWLGWQVIVSSFGVLRCAWWPGAEIGPTTARLESEVGTDLGLVTYANSITLTPGTLTLEAEPAPADGRGRPSLLVHALTPEGIDDLRSGAMDRRVARVEAPLRRRVEDAESQAQSQARSQARSQAQSQAESEAESQTSPPEASRSGKPGSYQRGEET